MSRTPTLRAKASSRPAFAAALFAAALMFTATMAATPAAAGEDFSPAKQFAEMWGGRLTDRALGGTNLAQAGTSAMEVDAAALARDTRSGPDFWGASLGRDTR